MNFPWGTNRRYNAYGDYFKQHFGERVQKVTVDAGFTCPNRDGTVSRGGCTYCNNDAFNPSYCKPEKSISQQIEEGIEFHRKRYRRAKKFLVYFQAFSNTHASLDHLRKLYGEALRFQDVVGLVIGTRPDCIDEEKLDYFKEINKSHYLIIEYGIESCYDKTLLRINRGHTLEQSVRAIELTASAGIKTGAHMIFGLPGESREEMINSADIIKSLPINNIKFHQLQIIKGTQMALDYEKSPHNYHLFEMEEYIDFIINYIQKLPPEWIIERFAGEVPPRFHAGPNWGIIRNDQVNRLIESKLFELNAWQGKLF